MVSIGDISQKTIDHVALKFAIPHKSTDAYEVISHADVDIVFILTSDEFQLVIAFHYVICY